MAQEFTEEQKSMKEQKPMREVEEFIQVTPMKQRAMHEKAPSGGSFFVYYQLFTWLFVCCQFVFALFYWRKAIIRRLKKSYLNVQGRSTIREYVLDELATTAAFFAGMLAYALFILPLLLFKGEVNSFFIALLTICLIAFIIFCLFLFFCVIIPVNVRRLHDLGFSGWWMITFIFFFPLRYFLLILPGKDKENAYGKSPYTPASPAAAA